MASTINKFIYDLGRKWPQLLIVFSAYLCLSLINSHLYNIVGTAPAVLFSTVGLGIVAVMAWGYAMWPALSLAAIAASLYSGNPIPLALVAGVSVSVQAVTTLFVIDKFRVQRSLAESRDLLIYLAVVTFTTMIAPTITIAARSIYGIQVGPVPSFVWGNLWLAGLVSATIYAPLLIRWIYPLRKYSHNELIEAGSALLALSAVTYILTYTPNEEFNGIPLLLPFSLVLLWLALRLGSYFTTLGMAIVAAFALSGIFFGNDLNPQNLSIPERIVSSQIGVILFGLMFYFIATLEEGRRDALRKLKQYTDNLEQSLDEKELDSEAKNEFIAVLGHEIRNPLASILSSVEILKFTGKSDAERQRVLASMEDRIRSMGRLLDDMFDISRITRRKLVLKKDLIRARDVLRRSAETVQTYMSKNKHQFHCTLPDKNVLLYADPVRIEQIVTNLLYNAAKYTPAGGTIYFSTVFERGVSKADEGEIIVRVRDTGVGLTEEEQSRIFEPFTQINPRQSLMGGIGLGLTLAKSLVDMHEGSIDVQSDGLGRGSEFIVRIPARLGTLTMQEKQPVQAVPTAPSENKSSAKILVVDDNVEAARGLSKLLEFHGHVVATANDGASGLKKAAELNPSTVVLDIGLPDMDGFEVARALRASKNTSTLIALSGYGQDDHKKRAREAGFDYYLTKPVSVEEVNTIVEKQRKNATANSGSKDHRLS